MGWLFGFFLIVVLLAVAGGLRFRTRQRYGPWTECPRCGYSLSGLPAEAPCPECGVDDPRHALKEDLRPVYQWSALLFPVLAVGVAMLAVAMETPVQRVLENAWNGYGRWVTSASFTSYRGLLFRPLGTVAAIGSMSLAVLGFVLGKRWYRIQLDRIDAVLLITAHVVLCVIGFWGGFYVGWLDAYDHHAHTLAWTYGGAFAGSLPGAVLIYRYVVRSRVLPLVEPADGPARTPEGP